MMHLEQPTIGPILGARLYGVHKVDQSLTIRGRDEWTDQTCFLHLESDDGSEEEYYKLTLDIDPNFDLVGKLTLKNLQFNTNYHYRVGIVQGDVSLDVAREETLDGGYTGSFSTANPDISETRFVFGSCCHFSQLSLKQANDDAAFKSVIEQWNRPNNVKDDFILMLGDQIYGDHPNGMGLLDARPFLCIKKLTLEHYLTHYRKAFAKRHKRELMASIPTYMIFDDHEVHNNWGSKKFLDDKANLQALKNGLQAYNLYQVSHPDIMAPELSDVSHKEPLPDAKYYYEFSHGNSDFFVMDTRYEKVSGERNHRMISNTQMSALKSFLDRGRHRVKFIVSSVPMMPDSKRSILIGWIDSNPKERWEGFTEQRKEIFDHIKNNAQNGINPNVIVLSGDVHVSYVFNLSSSEDANFKLHQITSSAFNWSIGLQDANFSKSEALKGTDNEYKPKSLSGKFIHSSNYCKVAVTTDKVDVMFYRAKNGEHIRTITLDLIKPAQHA